MTYTVKNGTWCKDNAGEYFSCTRVGLIAAQAAGEISNGTRVVIHERLYTPGQLVDSFNPNPPEGCFVPDGSTFNANIYSELAAVLGGNALPDLRECTLVMVGRSGRSAITNHDEYTVGQFKNDQFAEHNHSASSTVTDPGHVHGVTDPGHVHGVTDPGHVHGVTDPGHDHGRGTYEITGRVEHVAESFNDNGTVYGAFEKETGYNDSRSPAETDYSNAGALDFKASNSWTGRSEEVTTGVSVDSHTTGVSVDSHKTGVTIDSHKTGISVDTTTSNTGAANNVTHGKQVGVYRYIAF